MLFLSYFGHLGFLQNLLNGVDGFGKEFLVELLELLTSNSQRNIVVVSQSNKLRNTLG